MTLTFKSKEGTLSVYFRPSEITTLQRSRHRFPFNKGESLSSYEYFQILDSVKWDRTLHEKLSGIRRLFCKNLTGAVLQ